MQKFILLLILAAFSVAQAPVPTISGTVYDTDGNPLPGVTIMEKSTQNGTVTDVNGHYDIKVTNERSTLVFVFVGYRSQEIKVGTKARIDVILELDIRSLEEVVVTGHSGKRKSGAVTRATYDMAMAPAQVWHEPAAHHTEEYDGIEENIFHRPTDKPLSTFSIDVDAASYSNLRRYLNMGQMPPKDAVRIEEMINYFDYDYTDPKDAHPFAIHTSVTRNPWNENHLLVKIGLQGKRMPRKSLPASNIVFLLDVSGSMDAPNKLPLLKSSLKMLTNELRPEDKVAIVVYAGAAGLVLPPTEGNNRGKILEALENLQAGGSTAGGAGIQLAYEVAQKHLVKGGNNRVILATDGDFNVGVSSNAEMQRLIEEKRETGIYLTVLGFGMGNYKDSKMETLADQGNGNYAYIDNIAEAKKVLVTEFGGTLFTIAKDVKIQVEFNPAQVQAYRLIGYENRLLRDEDFNDDQKDAGELGSGHTVTALYEVIPTGVESDFVKNVDPLKYQQKQSASNTEELLTVKFRYKAPDKSTSQLLQQVVQAEVSQPDANTEWAAAVAGFGMMLRDSEFKGNLTYAQVLAHAKKWKGADEYGYRTEMIRLIETASQLQ